MSKTHIAYAVFSGTVDDGPLKSEGLFFNITKCNNLVGNLEDTGHICFVYEIHHEDLNYRSDE